MSPTDRENEVGLSSIAETEAVESSARKTWQVWADGECLLTCYSVERAAEYASNLGRGWAHIDIVTITRETTRVR